MTDSFVTLSWRELFKSGFDVEAIQKAEKLLEQLRPENPLRHRLALELQEYKQRVA